MRYLLLLLFAVAVPQFVAAQMVTTYAGNGHWNDTGDNGLAINAGLRQARNVVFDNQGNLYITELRKIRKVATTGIITRFAGITGYGTSGDGGPAIDARFGEVAGIVCDAENNIYVSDPPRIRKINASDGIINTIAGSTQGFSGDGGPAMAATFNMPRHLAMDSQGNLYVSDRNNHRIRRIDPTGIVTTIAGNGTPGTAGDDGPAVDAQLNVITAMCIDGNDNLYVADDAYVRKIDLGTGIITRFAGTDTFTALYNGIPALEVGLVFPSGLAADKDNNIYISSDYIHMIRVIDENGIIHFVSGEGTSYFRDNIIADSACFNEPQGLAFDTCGNLFIADHGNHRVRKLWYNAGCYNLSVNEVTSYMECSLFPNPTTSTITIASSNKIKQVTITDITGREVIRSGETTIDVSALVSGVYFVRVRDENGGSKTEKIIKE